MNQEDKKLATKYIYFLQVKDERGRATIKELATDRPELRNFILEADKISEEPELSLAKTIKNFSLYDKFTAFIFAIVMLLLLRTFFNFADPPALVTIIRDILLREQIDFDADKLESLLYIVMYAIYLTFSWFSFLFLFINRVKNLDLVNPYIELFRIIIFTGIVLLTIEKIGTFVFT